MITNTKKLKEFISNIVKLIRKPVMSILPGQLSFFLLLSIIPTILIFGILASISSISTTNIVNTIKTSLPFNISELILPLLEGRGMDYNILILIISALLLTSKGARSIMTVASQVYDIEENKTIKTYFKSYILAILLVLSFTFLLVVPVLSSKILIILGKIEALSFAVDSLLDKVNLLKWPLTIIIIFISIKTIYIFSPNKQIPSKSVDRGTLFTTILWVLVTAIYSFYVNNLSSYNLFYGGASNIIILMLWIYLISYIFVLGMCINASYLKYYLHR